MASKPSTSNEGDGERGPPVGVIGDRAPISTLATHDRSDAQEPHHREDESSGVRSTSAPSPEARGPRRRALSEAFEAAALELRESLREHARASASEHANKRKPEQTRRDLVEIADENRSRRSEHRAQLATADRIDMPIVNRSLMHM